MNFLEFKTGSVRRLITTAFFAQAGALLSLSLASLLVARATSAAVVGEYALLRVLPWLMAVVCSSGLPVAAAYFLAAPGRRDRRLRPTITVMVVLAGVAGAALWAVAARLLHPVYFPSFSPGLLSLTSVLVITQLVTVTAKACCQGAGDIKAANAVTVAEELLFLPWYLAVLLLGLGHSRGVVVALVGGGASASVLGVALAARTGFFRRGGRPSVAIARRVAWYGARGQTGNVLWLLNLRLDFLILGAIAGPATLGVYAIASKFAELMRLGPIAINYVLYPRFSALPARESVADARHLLPRATLAVATAAPVIAAATVVVLPLLYGDAFDGALVPACIIIVGLIPEGAAAVSSALLWGLGRPGANSLAMAVGLVATVVLDILLIPHFGATGAAIASATAYLVTTAVLLMVAARAAHVIDAGGTRESLLAGRADQAPRTPANVESVV